MLYIECDKCKKRFWVEGYTTPDSWTEPGEVVTDLETDEDLCECLNDGETFNVIEESLETFDDDVI